MAEVLLGSVGVEDGFDILAPITWLNGFPIPTVSCPANPLFWLIFASAALIGLLIAYPAHFWLVKRQMVPWRALVTAGEMGEATAVEESGTSRVKILLLILVTYIILFGVVFWLISLL